jgi:hypothetical protein
MMMILTLLAQADGSGDRISMAGLGLLLAALAAFVGRMQGIHKGRKEAQDVQVTNNPLRVELEKEFVRREEWIAFRGEMRADLSKIEAMMSRVFDRIDMKHTELLATIERAAKTGVDGRVALWNELREQGQALAKVEAKTDVDSGLKKLAEELKEGRLKK